MPPFTPRSFVHSALMSRTSNTKQPCFFLIRLFFSFPCMFQALSWPCERRAPSGAAGGFGVWRGTDAGRGGGPEIQRRGERGGHARNLEDEEGGGGRTKAAVAAAEGGPSALFPPLLSLSERCALPLLRPSVLRSFVAAATGKGGRKGAARESTPHTHTSSSLAPLHNNCRNGRKDDAAAVAHKHTGLPALTERKDEGGRALRRRRKGEKKERTPAPLGLGPLRRRRRRRRHPRQSP